MEQVRVNWSVRPVQYDWSCCWAFLMQLDLNLGSGLLHCHEERSNKNKAILAHSWGISALDRRQTVCTEAALSRELSGLQCHVWVGNSEQVDLVYQPWVWNWPCRNFTDHLQYRPLPFRYWPHTDRLYRSHTYCLYQPHADHIQYWPHTNGHLHWPCTNHIPTEQLVHYYCVGQVNSKLIRVVEHCEKENSFKCWQGKWGDYG